MTLLLANRALGDAGVKHSLAGLAKACATTCNIPTRAVLAADDRAIIQVVASHTQAMIVQTQFL